MVKTERTFLGNGHCIFGYPMHPKANKLSKSAYFLALEQAENEFMAVGHDGLDRISKHRFKLKIHQFIQNTAY